MTSQNATVAVAVAPKDEPAKAPAKAATDKAPLKGASSSSSYNSLADVQKVKDARRKADGTEPDPLAPAEAGSQGSSNGGQDLFDEDEEDVLKQGAKKPKAASSSSQTKVLQQAAKTIFPWGRYNCFVGTAATATWIDLIYTGFMCKTMVEGVDYLTKDTSLESLYFKIPAYIVLSLLSLPNAPCDIGAIDWSAEAEDLTLLQETKQDKELTDWVGRCSATGQGCCAWFTVKFFTYLFKLTDQFGFAGLGSSDAITLAWFISQVYVRWGLGGAIVIMALLYYNMFSGANRDEGVLAFFKALAADCRDGMLVRMVSSPLMSIEAIIEIVCNIGYRAGMSVYMDWKLFTEVIGVKDDSKWTQGSMAVVGASTAGNALVARSLTAIAKNLDKEFATVTPEELAAGRATKITGVDITKDVVTSSFRALPLLYFIASRGATEAHPYAKVPVATVSSFLVFAHAMYAKTQSRRYRAALDVRKDLKEAAAKAAKEAEAVAASSSADVTVPISPDDTEAMVPKSAATSNGETHGEPLLTGFDRSDTMLPASSRTEQKVPLAGSQRKGSGAPQDFAHLDDPYFDMEEPENPSVWKDRKEAFEALAEIQRQKAGGKKFIIGAVAISRILRYFTWITAAMVVNQDLTDNTNFYANLGMTPLSRNEAAAGALVLGAQTFLQNEFDQFVKLMTDAVPKHLLRWIMEKVRPYPRQGFSCCCASACCCKPSTQPAPGGVFGRLAALFRPATQYKQWYLDYFRDNPGLLSPTLPTSSSDVSDTESGVRASDFHPIEDPGVATTGEPEKRKMCVIM